MITKPLLPVIIILTLSLSSCNNVEKEDFSFESQNTGMTGSMRGLDVLNESCVWICGSGGEYCFTNDAGQSWTKSIVPGAESLDFRDIHVFSEQSALLMSAGPGEASRIYRTDDAGKNWKLCHQNQDSLGFFDGMDFMDENTGVLFSDPVDAKLNLLVTKDGGKSWSRLNPALLPELKPGEYAFAASGTSIAFDWKGGIWIVTGGSVARIWHGYSLDGPWEITSPPVIQGDPAAGLFSVAPLSEINRIAVGGNYQNTELSGSNVVLWNEEELTWRIPDGAGNLPFMECVRWISTKIVVAAGPPGVYISADGGNEWSELFSDGFHTFDLSTNGRVGWMAADQGKVFKIKW